MSHTDNNVQRQKRRHRGPLIGMAVVVIFALVLLVWWLGYEAYEADGPQGAPAQIDGRTGETVDPPPLTPDEETPRPVQPDPDGRITPPGTDTTTP